MRSKTLFVVMLAVSAAVLVSGCTNFVRRAADRVGGGDCIELEEQLSERPGMECRCYPTDFVPEGVGNKTGLENFEGKCYCTCSYEDVGEQVNVSIVEGPDGQTIISTIK